MYIKEMVIQNLNAFRVLLLEKTTQKQKGRLVGKEYMNIRVINVLIADIIGVLLAFVFIMSIQVQKHLIFLEMKTGIGNHSEKN